MNIFQKVGSLILGFAEDDALPWLKNLFTHVEHDVVTNILPDVETALSTAGVTAIKDLSSGEKLGAALTAAGTALVSAAPAILAKSETVTLQDVFASAAAVLSNAQAAAAAAAQAPPPAPVSQTAAPAS